MPTPVHLSNLGPPGREHLRLLPPPSLADDARHRKLTLPPARVQRAARAVAEALFHADDKPADPARLDWLAADLLDFMARATGRAQLILRASLWALTWLAPLFVFTPLPLGWLPVGKRVLALERMELSPLGPAALAVKAMLCMIWFEHPDTQRETRTETSCLREP